MGAAQEYRAVRIANAGRRSHSGHIGGPDAGLEEIGRPVDLAAEQSLLRKKLGDVGALLRLREMIERNDRHLGQFQQLSRPQPAVAGDDPVFAVDEDRVRETELDNGRRDLGHLGVGMGPGVSVIGD